MKNIGRLAAVCVIVSGGATIVSVLLMRTMSGGNVQPFTMPNEAGFKSAMLWLELASTPEEVFQILGPPGSGKGRALRDNLNAANTYDYGFLVCYSLFNAFLIVFISHLNTYRFTGLIKLKTFLILGLILSCAMCIGDVVENLAIADLTQAPVVEDVNEHALQLLMYWTRVKWGSISLVCLMCSVGYTAYFRRIPPLLLPTGFAIAGISGLTAITLPDARFILDAITVPHLALVWSGAMVHAGVFAVKGPHRSLTPRYVPGAEDPSGDPIQ